MLVAAELGVIVGIGGDRFGLFRTPVGLQVGQRVGLARPVYQVGLAEFVEGGDFFHIDVTRIFDSQFDVADLDGRSADGPADADTDRVDPVHGAALAAQVDPARVAGVVEGGSQVVGRIRQLREVFQRNGEPVPGVRDIAHDAELVIAPVGGETELETLGRPDLVLEDDEIVVVPVGGQVRVDVLDGELCAGHFLAAVEGELGLLRAATCQQEQGGSESEENAFHG